MTTRNFLIDNDFEMCSIQCWVVTLKKFVNDKINERVKYVIAQKRMTIKALPEFVTIFKNSKNISVHKGRTNHLPKIYDKRKWDKIVSDDRDKPKEAENN